MPTEAFDLVLEGSLITVSFKDLFTEFDCLF